MPEIFFAQSGLDRTFRYFSSRSACAPGPATQDLLRLWIVRFRASCNGWLQTPPGPEGSNGSGLTRVPRITRGLADFLPLFPCTR